MEEHRLLESTSDYIYEPIPSAVPAIRLLTVQRGVKDDVLQTSLRICPLGFTIPAYKAISYCWGDLTGDDGVPSIIVDGKSLSITKNAYMALLSCRSASKEVCVWIDQVCINQSDLDERSEQIQHMGDIFRRAALVIINLGEEIDNTKLLFKFMELTRFDVPGYLPKWARPQRIAVPEKSLINQVLRPGTKLTANKIGALQPLSHRVSEIRAAFNKLMALPWFKRAWIVQEAGLARTAVVHLGNYEVEFEAICTTLTQMPYGKEIYLLPESAIPGFKTIAALHLLNSDLQPTPWGEIFWSVVRTLKGAFNTSSESIICRLSAALSRTNYLPIHLLLREFRHQESRDNRDKLFSMFGMMDPALMGSFTSQLSYSKSYIDCCIEFGLIHIATTGYLDILSATCHTGPAYDVLPYWTPDFAQKAPQCDTKFCMGTYKDPPHAAGLRYPVKAGYFDHNKALVVSGFQIDEVTEVVEGDGFSVYTYADPTAPAWNKWTPFAMKNVPNSPYESEDKRWEAYWRTLVYDSSGGSDHPDESLGEDIREFFNSKENHDSASLVQGKFAGRFVWVCRKLYRTKRGYLGNGCSNVKPGDKIFICHGGRFPLLLREDKPVEGDITGIVGNWKAHEMRGSLVGHLLIGGDTYVHGLCKGEAFDIALREGISTSLVCLT